MTINTNGCLPSMRRLHMTDRPFARRARRAVLQAALIVPLLAATGSSFATVVANTSRCSHGHCFATTGFDLLSPKHA